MTGSRGMMSRTGLADSMDCAPDVPDSSALVLLHTRPAAQLKRKSSDGPTWASLHWPNKVTDAILIRCSCIAMTLAWPLWVS